MLFVLTSERVLRTPFACQNTQQKESRLVRIIQNWMTTGLA